ncbi:hypothetical protein D3C87_1387500 [compost metagenome]
MPVGRKYDPHPESPHQLLVELLIIERLAAIPEFMKVQYEEFIRVAIKKRQHCLDQFVQYPTRAMATVLKVKNRLRIFRVFEANIQGPCAIGQLPGK